MQLRFQSHCAAKCIVCCAFPKANIKKVPLRFLHEDNALSGKPFVTASVCSCWRRINCRMKPRPPALAAAEQRNNPSSQRRGYEMEKNSTESAGDYGMGRKPHPPTLAVTTFNATLARYVVYLLRLMALAPGFVILLPTIVTVQFLAMRTPAVPGLTITFFDMVPLLPS